MPMSTMTSKGQITLPKEIRDYLHADIGTKLHFSIQDNGEIIMKAVNRPIQELEGYLSKYVKRTVSIEEMNQAIKRKGAGLP